MRPRASSAGNPSMHGPWDVLYVEPVIVSPPRSVNSVRPWLSEGRTGITLILPNLNLNDSVMDDDVEIKDSLQRLLDSSTEEDAEPVEAVVDHWYEREEDEQAAAAGYDHWFGQDDEEEVGACEGLRGTPGEGEQELNLSMNVDPANTSGMLKDMEQELAESGDLDVCKDPSRDKTSTPLPKETKKMDTGFRDWNRTVIDSESDTMSQKTTSTKRSRGSRGGRKKRKDLSSEEQNPQKAWKDGNGNRIHIRAPLLDVGPDIGMGGSGATPKNSTRDKDKDKEEGTTSSIKTIAERSMGLAPPNALNYIADLMNQRRREQGNDQSAKQPNKKGLVVHNYKWTKRSDVVRSEATVGCLLYTSPSPRD